MEKVKPISDHSKTNSEFAIGNNLYPVDLDSCKLTEGFWQVRAELVREKIIPYQFEVLNDKISGIEKSHAIENFRIAAGETEGEFYGRPFQDSDVYKWLEAVAYSITDNRSPELEAKADEIIDLIARAQCPDGYLDTFFIIGQMDKRWTNVRDLHELYCAGHLIEAAVAYYKATGKSKILDVACRLADHIDSVFGDEPGKKRGYPGHEEIELALIKLYHCTGEKRYLKLSQFFIEERGKTPNFFEIEAKERGDQEPYGPTQGKYTFEYNQSHLPVREQKTAVGHAVRAMYFYCGIADIARETGDQSLVDTCKALWYNVINRQMYLTGSIGSSHFGEAFTFDYDLPNDTAYNETCAAIGLVFWAHRMLHLEVNSVYADVMETALYNGVLSGMSLDGTRYFYVNPLEVWPQSCKKRNDKQHVATVRKEWFGCACCPTNLARLLTSLSRYIYSKSSDEIYVHLYTSSLANIKMLGQTVAINQKTNYPWDETVNFEISTEKPVEFTLGLRIPAWCRNYRVEVNGSPIETCSLVKKGYVQIRRLWKQGDQIDLIFDMPVDRVRANPQLRACAGKVALRRGPIVYCLEERDNGAVLTDISLPREAKLEARFEPDFLGGVVVITAEGRRSEPLLFEDTLYTTQASTRQPFKLTAVPYFAWNNEKPGEMIVWIREE